MAVFRKKILLPDSYKVRGSNQDITTDRMRKWVRNFKVLRERGYKIPAPFRHDEKAVPMRVPDGEDVDAFNNGGFWDKIYLRNGQLWGKLIVEDEEKAKKLRNGEITEVSPAVMPELEPGKGDKIDSETITHIALVTHPVAPNQEGFQEEQEIAAALCFSRIDGENYDEEDEGWEFQAVGRVVETTDIPMNAEDASVEDAIKILQRLGLHLPADTNKSNFLERVVTAGIAVAGNVGGVQEQPVPPETLSQEEQFDMSKEQDKAPDTPTISPQEKAAINFAQKMATDSYKSRIEALVNQGKVTPKVANEKLAPLLTNMQIQFSAEGQPIVGQLDVILDCLEAIPEKSTLVSVPDIQQHGQMFSMATDVQEETPPEDAWPDPDVGSEEDADKLIDSIPAWKTRVR